MADHLINDNLIANMKAQLANINATLDAVKAVPHTDPVIPTGVAPVADFTGTPLSETVVPMIVKFTNKSTGTAPLTFKWDFSDGAGNLPENTQKDPTWRFWDVKSYTIKLTVTNAYGSNTITRTNYVTVGGVVVTPPPVTPPATDIIPEFGCPELFLGSKIGGGIGYNRIVTSGPISVMTKEQLISALVNAKDGDIIFIPQSTVIDLSNSDKIIVGADDVTLASNRGYNGSLGGTIRKKYGGGAWPWEQPAIVATGDNFRLTGVQLEGEMFPQDSTGSGEAKYLVGIEADHTNGFEVDNCELRGWSWASVSLDHSKKSHVHHNFIHSNQARGEGYGTCHYGGDALIEANIYNFNRHDITGAGFAGENYEFRYNICLGQGTASGGSRVDVHADEAGGHFAGDLYRIHHNIFKAPTGQQSLLPIQISEKPVTGCYIDNNIFEGSAVVGGYYTGPIRQLVFDSFGRMFLSRNMWQNKVISGDSIVMYEKR